MLKLGTKIIAVAGGLILTSAAGIAQQYETVDGGTPVTTTQRGGMHACPQNRYITGVEGEKIRLLCALMPPGYNPATDEHADGMPGTQPHQEQQMHACPKGSVMSGLNVNRNEFLCVPSPLDPTGTDPHVIRFRDEPSTVVAVPGHAGGTQRDVMHACPIGLPMAGIHVTNDWVLCEVKLPFTVPAR